MSDFHNHEIEWIGSGIELRTAGIDDHDLVRRIVGLAMNWRDEQVPHEVHPDGHKYFSGWGRPGDLGVMAFSGIEFVGGASVRQFSNSDGAYGYIDEAIPELTIGVEVNYRRRGIAAILLAALKAKVVEAGVRGISLSVEPDNGARHLYRRMGFDLVEDRGGDLLMLWQQ